MDTVYVTREDLEPDHANAGLHDIGFWMLSQRVHELALLAVEVVFVDDKGAAKTINDKRTHGHLTVEDYASVVDGDLAVFGSKGVLAAIETRLNTNKPCNPWAAPVEVEVVRNPIRLLVAFENSMDTVKCGFWLLRRAWKYDVEIRGDFKKLAR